MLKTWFVHLQFHFGQHAMLPFWPQATKPWWMLCSLGNQSANDPPRSHLKSQRALRKHPGPAVDNIIDRQTEMRRFGMQFHIIWWSICLSSQIQTHLIWFWPMPDKHCSSSEQDCQNRHCSSSATFHHHHEICLILISINTTTTHFATTLFLLTCSNPKCLQFIIKY